MEESVGVHYRVLPGICYNPFLLLDSVQSLRFLYFNNVTSWFIDLGWFLLIATNMNPFTSFPGPHSGFFLAGSVVIVHLIGVSGPSSG